MGSTRDILRVLVADDEVQICTLIREMLTQMGHFVEMCHDGEDALKAYEDQGRFGLVVLDVMMPLKTGVEVVQELRGRGENVPVLLMSSFLPEEVLSSLEGYERVAFLQKPFSLAEFRATVERITRPVRC